MHCSLRVTIRSRNGLFLLHTIKEDNTSKCWFFLTCSQLMRYPLIKLFHFSSLLQMLNDCRMVHVEFFGNFSCSCKSSSFDDLLNWSLSTSSGWPLHLSSKFSSPLQNFLNNHCTVHLLAVHKLNVLLMLWVVSTTLWPFWTWIRKLLKFAFCLTSFP